MQLKWRQSKVVEEGDRVFVEFLIDEETQRCYATICHPSDGDILYGTSLKFNGPDEHFYATLEAAQAYCEEMATIFDEIENEEYICDDCRAAAEDDAATIPHTHRKALKN
jgi:hypothetical protein